MTDILTLISTLLPMILLIAFPLLLVRALDSTGAPEPVPFELEPEPSFGAERARPTSVEATRPACARA